MKKKNKYIYKWLYYNNKLREINKYLFEHTELYEQKYTTDFEEELFNFFAGKIQRYTRDENKLRSLLSNSDRQEIIEYKLLNEE